MAADLAKINKAREINGLPPLEKLATDPTLDKPADQITPNTDPANELPKHNLELSDAELLQLLKSRGIETASLEDLKPKPTTVEKTKEQLAEERESARISFGLTKGHFNKKDYETFITDNSNREGLVYAQYLQDAKEDDPEMTEEDIRAEFISKYGLDAEENTRKHKRGQDEINVLADRILSNKHKKIFDADSAFSNYELENIKKSDYQKTILEKTPVLQNEIKGIFKGLKKITFDLSDQEKAEFELTDEMIADYESKFLDPKFIEYHINAGTTPEVLRNAAYTSVVTKNLPFILKEHVKQAFLKKGAGARGIIPNPATSSKADLNKPTLTPEQQKMYDEMVAEKEKQNRGKFVNELNNPVAN